MMRRWFRFSFLCFHVYTSAVYWPGAPIEFGTDFHASYFNDWLRFAGVTDVSEIRFQPNLVATDAAADRKSALARARELGEQLATPAPAGREPGEQPATPAAAGRKPGEQPATPAPAGRELGEQLATPAPVG
jgi:hypothetical protein